MHMEQLNLFRLPDWVHGMADAMQRAARRANAWLDAREALRDARLQNLELLRMPDRVLRDMGITRHQILQDLYGDRNAKQSDR